MEYIKEQRRLGLIGCARLISDFAVRIYLALNIIIFNKSLASRPKTFSDCVSISTCRSETTVKPQWFEHLFDYGNLFQT